MARGVFHHVNYEGYKNQMFDDDDNNIMDYFIFNFKHLPTSYNGFGVVGLTSGTSCGSYEIIATPRRGYNICGRRQESDNKIRLATHISTTLYSGRLRITLETARLLFSVKVNVLLYTYVIYIYTAIVIRGRLVQVKIIADELTCGIKIYKSFM